MRLQSIQTIDVARLPDRTFDLRGRTGTPASLVFVTGPTGSGKTLLLDVIAAAKETVAPYGGRPEVRRFTKDANTGAKVVLEWALSESDRARFPGVERTSTETMWGGRLGLPPENDQHLLDLLGSYEPEVARSKVEYFRADRALPAGTSVGGRRNRRFERMALEDNGKYDGLDGWVTDLCMEGIARVGANQPPSIELARFARAFALVCGTVTFQGIVKTRDGMEPGFRRGADDIALSGLSHGEKQAFLFAAHMCRSTVTDSLVLVDSPETMMDPSTLVQFVKGLTEIALANQFIIATAHRALVREFTNDSVHIDLGVPR
ncbi:MAG: hypothetical protein U0414_24985 [Polyangiaceae bacterium]